MQNEDYKILFERLQVKVKQMRELQRKKHILKNWFPLQDKQKLYRLQAEVDNMTMLDEEGRKVYVKNNR